MKADKGKSFEPNNNLTNWINIVKKTFHINDTESALSFIQNLNEAIDKNKQK